MSDEKPEMSESEKKKEDWMNSKWRPMMGWMYMVVCTMDFVMFPILWSGLQAIMKVGQITQWNPLTLQGAGLFHIAMGAVLGLAAFGRTQEKIAGANNGGAVALPSNFGTSAPSTGGFGNATTTTPSGSSTFGAPQTGSFGGTSSFGSTTPTPGPSPVQTPPPIFGAPPPPPR